MRIRILTFNLMRIHADPDPQHCSKEPLPELKKAAYPLKGYSAVCTPNDAPVVQEVGQKSVFLHTVKDIWIVEHIRLPRG